MFNETFDRTIGSEGCFQINEKDRGNWTSGKVGEGKLKGTKWGLAAMTYPDLDIKNITYEEAKVIYKRDWWDKLKMESFPKALQYQMFDASFNHGSGRANQMLQRAVGAKDDGKIGPLTLEAVRKMDVNDVLMNFLAERLEYFTNVKTWQEFSKGWVRRVAHCLRYAAKDN